MAAASARPMPVLPDVGSMSVSPGLIRPARSASFVVWFGLVVGFSVWCVCVKCVCVWLSCALRF